MRLIAAVLFRLGSPKPQGHSQGKTGMSGSGGAPHVPCAWAQRRKRYLLDTGGGTVWSQQIKVCPFVPLERPRSTSAKATTLSQVFFHTLLIRFCTD